jgi:S-formylglutathione hydrolase FrmB
VKQKNKLIQTINFQSKLNKRVLPYIAILPQDYFETNKEYPVFYLMHGLFGSFENWTTLTDLIEYAKEYEFIIICPEGKNSWYLDNPNLENHFYESYVLNELIPDVEARFRVKNERNFRAIGGISMGGYGAFKFAFRKPELFCCAASMSGAFDTPDFLENIENKWLELHPYIADAFTDMSEDAIKHEDIFHLAEIFPAEKVRSLPYFYFDCGQQDSFISINRKFSKLLNIRKISHQFLEVPGEHDWDYWDKQIKIILKKISDNFKP